MAPSALIASQSPQLTQEPVDFSIKRALSRTTPSQTLKSSYISSHLQDLDASKLDFSLNPDPKTVPEPNSPEVWAQKTYEAVQPYPRMWLTANDTYLSCTDHMITCSWNCNSGWQSPHLIPYGPLSLMPTASVLHYATECFEGLKFYRGHDSRLRLFRPDRNCSRMLASATRIALPAFDPRELQKLIETLVRVDGPKWLPRSRPGSFLYLRPTMIANAAALGVQKPKEALLFIIACCFPPLDEPALIAQSQNQPLSGKRKPGMKLLASQDDMIRAWPGGFGFAKIGANYGPSLIAQGEAQDLGFDQILWLFGENCEVTEAGASNFFVVWRTGGGELQLVTAPLFDKVILDGVTRRSVLDLAKDRLSATREGLQGLSVVERKYTMREVEEAIEEGRLVEAFAAGTAVFLRSMIRAWEQAMLTILSVLHRSGV